MKQYPRPFSPLSSTKEPSTFGRTMNYEYTSLYRARLFSFDLNFYSQFILSWKNGSNESMNYDRGWARFVRIFMRYRVPWRLRISIYPWRQCFLLLRMHTNNFHPLSLWLCNHFKLQRFIHRVIQFHVYIFQVTGLLRFIIFLKLVVKVTCHEIALYHCETSYYKILFLYYYDILEKNFLEGIEI